MPGYRKRGPLIFSVLRIWPIFGSVFRFSHCKTTVFQFWCLARFAGFLQFSVWFSVFVTIMVFFRIFVPSAFYGSVLILLRKLPPAVALKLYLKGSLTWRSTLSFRGMDNKLSLFSSSYLGRNGCQAYYEKPKITSKKKTIIKYHAPGIISCGL